MKKKLYIVTTKKCNLRCPHCYVDFDNEEYNEEEFLKQLNSFEGRLILFGGEFSYDMERFRSILASNKKDGISKIGSGSTNLVILNDELLEFYKNIGGIGTSWNLNRFGNDKNYETWKKNLRTVVDEGVRITILITLTKDLIELEPSKFINIVKDFIYKDIIIKLEQYVGNDVDQAHYDKVDNWLCEVYKQWDLPNKLSPTKKDLEYWYHDCSEVYTLFPDGKLVNKCPHDETSKIPEMCFGCDRVEICRPCQLIPYCSYPHKLAKLIKEKKEEEGR